MTMAAITLLGLVLKWVILNSLKGEWCVSSHEDENNGTIICVRTLFTFVVLSITIIVAAVPEGLPISVTITLA